MKKFFQNYQDWILGIFAVLLFVVLVWYFTWGLAALGNDLARALSPPKTGAENLKFDIDGYKKLGLES